MAKRTIKKKRRVKPIEAHQVTVRQRLDGIPLELDSLQREIVTLMRRARIPPELIYAYLRTGLIVAEENYEHLSSEDRHDWDRAIMEYLQHVKTRTPMTG